MKNTNLKLNKTKLVARLMVVVSWCYEFGILPHSR